MSLKARKHLDAMGDGITDYDYSNDILFFKIKEREYDVSLEFGDMIVDFDTGGFVIGIQVMEASKFFSDDFHKLSKTFFKNKIQWKYEAIVDHDSRTIDIILNFQVVRRNKTIDFRPAISRPVPEDIPILDTETLCPIPAV